jgi:hypothetical protein
MTATEQKKAVKLSPEVLKAIAWLDRVTEPDGGVRRWIDMSTGELGTISTEITGYAAHLFAWLALVTGEEIYLERARLHAAWIWQLYRDNDFEFLPFEPGSDLTYFFDCGIAVRGLQATGGREYSAAAHEVAECNLDWRRVTPKPGWWSSEPGTHQFKALLAMPKPYPNAVLGERFKPAGELMHPMSYTAEALFLSGDKKMAFTQTLDIRPWEHSLMRCDALAQIIRLTIALDGKAYPNIKALEAFQDPETGGFWFAKKDGEFVPHLSTHVAIFAIQAMVMNELGGMPDFGELSIV